MLSNINISDILTAARGVDASITKQDLAYLILIDTIRDKSEAYQLAYGRPLDYGVDIEDYNASKRMRALASAAKPFGVGGKDNNAISREENQSELISMLKDIKKAMDNEDMDVATGLKMMADIRVKLQDKFDMEEDKDEEKHIIVVPQKHDYICPHTSRECSKMPSKEACMKYYGLSDEEGRTLAKDKPVKSRKVTDREPIEFDLRRPGEE